MAARRTRKRSSLAGGLSLLAVCGLIIGAVFVLTSNQGCMRAISGRGAVSTTPRQAAHQPSQQAEKEQPAAEPGSEARQEAGTTKKSEAGTPAPSQTDKSAQPATSPDTSDPAKEPQQDKRAGRDPVTDMHTSSTHLGSMGEVSRGSTASPKIAITLDAGASAVPTDKILKVLAKHGVHCTFFLTGKWIEQNPGLTRRIVAEGHEIGNHTYSHPRLTGLSEGEIASQVERTERLVQKAAGVSTKPLFRCPYGSRDKRVLRILGRLGYRSVYWHVDCWDSVKAGITSDQITRRVLNLVGNGSIVLMHCGSQATADAMDALLTQLESRGYQPVTVSELLN